MFHACMHKNDKSKMVFKIVLDGVQHVILQDYILASFSPAPLKYYLFHV